MQYVDACSTQVDQHVNPARIVSWHVLLSSFISPTSINILFMQVPLLAASSYASSPSNQAHLRIPNPSFRS